MGFYICNYETLKSMDANSIDMVCEEAVNKRQQNAKVEERKEEAIKAQAPGPKTAEVFRQEAIDKKTEDMNE
jgi:hypothetical protein